MADPSNLQRFDSTMFDILRNEEGDNLLDFDELAGLFTDEIPLQLGLPPASFQPAVTVTTLGPAAEQYKAEPQVQEGRPSLTPSGAAESEHTRAPNWPSSGSDSDGSDGEHHGPGQEQQPGGARSGVSGNTRSGKGANKGGSGAGSGVRKSRRQRNAEQMEMNRVAQQKYRQRKKQEQNALQAAVDMLTAQVAALKALEVRNAELVNANSSLQGTVHAQSGTITALQQHAAQQAAQLDATRAALVNSQAQVSSQQRVILDQQAKLRLQEEVIASLKDRLKERIDEAMQHVVPGTVCEKMVAAVKATLYGAKDMQGLQDTLATLPEHLVTEICKNIFQVFKETWPEMQQRCSKMVMCPASVQGKCT